jgi:hypothetical protein
MLYSVHQESASGITGCCDLPAGCNDLFRRGKANGANDAGKQDPEEDCDGDGHGTTDDRSAMPGVVLLVPHLALLGNVLAASRLERARFALDHRRDTR